MWLSSKKTLFIKTESGSDLADGCSLPPLDLERRTPACELGGLCEDVQCIIACNNEILMRRDLGLLVADWIADYSLVM